MRKKNRKKNVLKRLRSLAGNHKQRTFEISMAGTVYGDLKCYEKWKGQPRNVKTVQR